MISPGTRNFARWWLLGVLAAVYPANVHMTLHPERYKQVPRWPCGPACRSSSHAHTGSGARPRPSSARS